MTRQSAATSHNNSHWSWKNSVYLICWIICSSILYNICCKCRSVIHCGEFTVSGAETWNNLCNDKFYSPRLHPYLSLPKHLHDPYCPGPFCACLSVYVCVCVRTFVWALRMHAYICVYCVRVHMSIPRCACTTAWVRACAWVLCQFEEHQGTTQEEAPRGTHTLKTQPKAEPSSVRTTAESPCWAASALKKPWLRHT